MDNTETQAPPPKQKNYTLLLAFLIVLILIGLVAISFKNKKSSPQESVSTSKTNLPNANMMNTNFLPPANETVSVGAEASTEMIVKGSDASKKISGAQLKFVTTGPVKIKDITLVRTDGGALTILKKEITSTEATIVGVIIENEEKLPSEVKAKIQFSAISPGTVKFNLDSKSAQVTGPIEANSYTLSQADPSTFIVK